MVLTAQYPQYDTGTDVAIDGRDDIQKGKAYLAVPFLKRQRLMACLTDMPPAGRGPLACAMTNQGSNETLQMSPGRPKKTTQAPKRHPTR